MPINRSIFLAQTLALILASPFCINAQEKSHVTSEQVTHAVEQLEKLAQKQINENAPPGLAIAVVFQDKTVYAKGFGVRDVNTKEPVDADTVFQLASVSKSIGSTVVAELIGERKITWDSKLNALDPTFEMFEPWVTREQLGVVVLTNAYPIGIAEALGTTFLDTALYGKPTQDWFAVFKQAFSNPAAVGTVLGFDYSKPAASPAPALKNSAYVGRYTNDYFGDISIIEKDGGLAIVEGPQNKTFPMRHYDRDTFTYETADENAVGRSGVTFTIAPDGGPNQVAVENLNVSGEGTFKRAEK
jgi:Beta-lactamase/Domain of unknown function (DUF3471)